MYLFLFAFSSCIHIIHRITSHLYVAKRTSVPCIDQNAPHNFTKKVAKLKQAADFHHVFALLRSGGAPGIMYVEGEERGVRQWVDAVHNLRYKDYQLVSRPAVLERENEASDKMLSKRGLHEIATVKDFGQEMQDRGVYDWWRKGMGYVS
ncbi:hypothetical protein H2203_002239 [Taxawa tesnikishii (nom. ined.)]|nr:hypothetical protein H2203_002239 [Dothideales sp. JES 119]